MAQQLEQFIATYGANANRVRQDIGAVRGRFPNLLCEGDNYVQNNGVTQRLIKFAGTIPISYRGATYHIPVTVWIPPTYPFQGPNIFVSPTADMAIKQQHQHVDMDGRCYLPSLSQWNPANQNGLVQALTELQGVCAVNPPVYAKPKDAPVYKGPANPYASATTSQPSGGGAAVGAWGSGNNNNAYSSPSPPQPQYGGNNSGGVGNNAAMAAVQAQQQRDLKGKCVEVITAQCKALATEMNQFMTMQNKLVDGEREIADQLHRMDLHSQQLDAALKWTRNATQECDAAIASQQATQSAEINVDEIVVPVNGLSGQLLESLAASHAIEDAIYLLNKGLASDVKMDAATYCKEMRLLCSEQFVLLATIRKIHAAMLK